ncbi:MAG: hypothetical protein IPJ41_13080 [Phycisphaerales bacterium]|nr:hypothetical protein [Phycisphaerales bacterium]
MIPRIPGPRVCKPAFVLYALALVTATHWPSLAVESPFIPRLDLFIHTSVFAGWTTLLFLAGFLGPRNDPRTAWRGCFVALAYALVDELTQGFPILHRTVDPLDLAANATGIVVASALLARWARHVGTPPDAR